MFEIFENINGTNNFLVIPDTLKTRVISLKSLYEINNKKLLEFKILTTSELVELFSFKVDKNIIIDNVINFKVPISVTKEKIKFSRYNSKKINEDLNSFLEINKKHIIINENFIRNINKYIFYLLDNDILIKHFLLLHQVKYQTINFSNQKKPKIKKFQNKEEELFYLFEEIAKLLENGFDINKIYLANVNDTYLQDIKRFTKFYQFPINLNIKESLYNIPYIRDILDLDYEEIIEILKNSEIRNLKYEKVRALDEFEFDLNINKMIKIFNTYYYEQYEGKDVIKIITEEIKNTFSNVDKIMDAISIIDIKEVLALEPDAKVFVLNAVYESFPTILKDNEYLSDKDKIVIDYPTSSNINSSNNEYLKKIITLNQIAYISYPLQDKVREYTISDVIENLVTPNYEPTKITIDYLKKGYAKEYYRLFFNNVNANDKLLSTFTGEFKLSNDEKEELKSYLRLRNIKVSPSEISTYYQIPFIYYLEKILGITSFKESISINIGNFFHVITDVLLRILYANKITNLNKRIVRDEDTNNNLFAYISSYQNKEIFDMKNYFEEIFKVYFEKEIININEFKLRDISTLNDLEIITIKTDFYINKNKNIIIDALTLIMDLEENIPSKELLIEEKIEFENLKGKADLVKVYEDNRYSVIDFKSSERPSFKAEKVIMLINALLKSDNEEIATADLNLLQILIYGYFINRKNEELKMKDVSYYSFFSDKLNGLATEELEKRYYKDPKNRVITSDELKQLFIDLERLLNRTIEKILNFDFPIAVRLDSKTKTGQDENFYAIYEALAFFNNNGLEDKEDE